MTAEPVPDTLIPRAPSLEEALKSIEPAAESSPEERASNPMAQEVYGFDVAIMSGNGSKLGGSFKSRILSIEDKINVGLLQSKIVRGLPWGTLDADTQYIVEMVAHLVTSLVEKPKDFKLYELKNVRYLEAIYAEVAAHERYFRGPGST